jgi:hypothetical protein
VSSLTNAGLETFFVSSRKTPAGPTQGIDYGHDRTLLRQNLERTPSERIDHGTAFANFVLRDRGTARAR